MLWVKLYSSTGEWGGLVGGLEEKWSLSYLSLILEVEADAELGKS